MWLFGGTVAWSVTSRAVRHRRRCDDDGTCHVVDGVKYHNLMLGETTIFFFKLTVYFDLDVNCKEKVSVELTELTSYLSSVENVYTIISNSLT